ncbi:MAG TPA: WD40 repeat domain-containing protein [Candidatus Bathyarchaeia archaeon]|nr:WD40 repeat domain-containing protein [Candidatus Bathyarchaeia archaeon]
MGCIKTKEPIIIHAHEDQVMDLKFTKNNKVIISAGKDQAIRFWEAPNWEFRFELAGHSECVNILGLKGSENLLFSGSDDKTIKVWDLEERNEILSFNNDKSPIISLEISPEEAILVSGSKDGSIKLYCLESLEVIADLKDNTTIASCFAFSPDSSYLISGSKDTEIAVWDIPQGKLKRIISSNIKSPISIFHFNKGKKLFVAGKDGVISILNTKDWLVEKTIKFDQTNYIKMILSPDERYIAAFNDSMIQLWSLNEGEKISEYKLKSKGIITAVFSQNTKHIAIGCADGNILIFDLNDTLK